MTKSEKTSKKTTVSRTAKPAKKKFEKLDLDTFTVSLNELAYILGLASGNITVMVQNGAVVKDADGRVNLRDTVSSYCRRMRERKEGVKTKSDIDTETAIWKLQNIKQKNRDWRMSRDRMVATEILGRLTNAMLELREMAKLNPALVEAIDKMVQMIGSVNVDDIPTIIEGSDEEDED